MNKIRLDMLILERGLASTRSKAQELVAAGFVQVEGAICKKPGEKIDPASSLSLLKEEHPYVSRGGVKLAAALSQFQVSPIDKNILDVGISTGGFSDCLLRAGAKKIYGVDVGSNQLAPSIRNDSRVTVFESTHVKDLRPEQIACPIDLLVADLSFISLKKVIPFFKPFFGAYAELILLVKPQFELEKNKIGSGGIVKNAKDRGRAIEGVRQCLEENGYLLKGEILSPITGGDGNIESFLHAVLGSPKP